MYSGYAGDHREDFDGANLGARSSREFDLGLIGVSAVSDQLVAQLILDNWLAAQGVASKSASRLKIAFRVDPHSRYEFFDLPAHQAILGKDCRPCNINDPKLGVNILRGQIVITPSIAGAAIALAAADQKYATIAEDAKQKLESALAVQAQISRQVEQVKQAEKAA